MISPPAELTANVSAKKSRLIVVAHQIPWVYNSDSDTFSVRRGHEAQFSGPLSLASSYSILHIGWAKEPQTEKSIKEFYTQKKAFIVSVPDTVAVGHYEGYCKNELWPLFHYILWDNATDGQIEGKNWNYYKEMNEAFAQEICKVYEPGDMSKIFCRI